MHPALDFYDGKAIVSIGEQIQYTYSDQSINFSDGDYTILSTGETFICSQPELAKRRLYYSRGLDLPMCRWEYRDIEDFCKSVQNGHKPVADIKTLYSTIRNLIIHYIDFEDHKVYDVLACFIVYTYFHPLFQNAPILQFWGEMKTGKTKTVSLLSALCFNPVNSANISESSVFRLVEGRRATLLLDESEDLMTSDRGKAISNLLLAGYNKSGETFRQERDNSNGRYKTVSFMVFSPKVIANISGVSLAPLLSRTIRIITTGASDKAKANRELNQDDITFQKIRNYLYRLVMLLHQQIATARDNMKKTELGDRAYGIWQGILTIASLIDDSTWYKVHSYAVENINDIQDELNRNNVGAALLRHLFLFIEQRGDADYTSLDLLDYVCRIEELEITTKRSLGDIMKRLGFKSKPKRIAAETHRVYYLSSSSILEKIHRYN